MTMDKLTVIRIIATIGMVVFLVGGIAALAGFRSWLLMIGGSLWLIFGIWAARLNVDLVAEKIAKEIAHD